MRREIVFILCLAAISAGEIYGQAVSRLRATVVASGLSQPLFVTAPPGDVSELFIVQQTGQVLVLSLQTGSVTTFLDIHSRLTSTSGEQGLLGMAFDPNYSYAGNSPGRQYRVTPQ